MSHQNYFVYILTNANRHTVLYIGVTNDLNAEKHFAGVRAASTRSQVNLL